jgi:integrase
MDKCGICSFDSGKILEFKIIREDHLSPCLAEDELACTLAQINRASVVGKRDYAIIVLAAQTGLRAHDIVNLKLSNIDWRHGEIHVLQHKTRAQVILPLTVAAGDAVKEYILHGRPDVECEYVFIRSKSPHQKLHDGVAIQYMFNEYQKKAGIARSPHDGKGFHSIRRLIGRNMATNGIPVTTITQVLGHIGDGAVTQYISLDSEHLRECALSFDGIEIEEVV